MLKQYRVHKLNSLKANQKKNSFRNKADSLWLLAYENGNGAAI